MVMNEPQPNRAFEWTQASWGQALRCVPLADVAPHLFTIRNLELRDNPLEWAAVAGDMRVAPDAIRLIRQVHGAAVAVARRGGPTWPRPEADAVVSDDPSVAIGVRVADCAPVLLADARRGVVAAAHAGWRGTALAVARAAVRAMQEHFGTDPADLTAAIGPSLGPCCGEVGQEVVDAFRAAGHGEPAIERWFATGPSGRPYLDLWTANRDQLVAAGVLPGRVFAAGLCTRTWPGHFHSYRLEREKAGRMLGIIRARG